LQGAELIAEEAIPCPTCRELIRQPKTAAFPLSSPVAQDSAVTPLPPEHIKPGLPETYPFGF